jgi:pyruvate kinase
MSPYPIKNIIQEVEEIIAFVEEKEREKMDLIDQVQLHYRESARNLIHYMALRSFDIRGLQEKLSHLGISAIAHCEAYVLANLYNILKLLYLIDNRSIENLEELSNVKTGFYESRMALENHTNALFGVSQDNKARIMVTMPSAAATDYDLIHDLLQAGMNIARINTSHDRSADWKKMSDIIKQAELSTGRSGIIYMDLSGPKLRTQVPEIPLSKKELKKLFKDKYKKKKGKHKKKAKKKKKDGIIVFAGDRVKIIRAGVETINPLDNPKPYVGVLSTTLPEIFDNIEEGHQIFFDDGKIGGIVRKVNSEEMSVEITQAEIGGSRLMNEKGINLPDTTLSLPSLTDADYGHLPFASKYADIVGYSFVRKPEDVEELQAELKRLGRLDIGIVLKIETKESFENLPELLLTAMRSPKVGVMIARGDLAVEIGFERTAEVQEEILWICEAAHVPGIWATQVLEKLAKKGLATRAEITDASMSSRAECVMLNKGPYVVDAVSTLNDILQRMAYHQCKRKGYLRPLSVAKKFLNGKNTSLKKKKKKKVVV